VHPLTLRFSTCSLLLHPPVTPCTVLHPVYTLVTAPLHPSTGVFRCASAICDLKNGARPFFKTECPFVVPANLLHVMYRESYLTGMRNRTLHFRFDRSALNHKSYLGVHIHRDGTCVYLKPNYFEIDPLQWGCFFFLSPPHKIGFALARSLGWHTLKPIRVHLDQNRGSILPLA